ncbi:MAG: glycine oxidase ThiO [Myxococcales bacterium]|nr:glycine oxidase ThiO [Myxococcales bacterium]
MAPLRVVIVGGGVMGCAIAGKLARRDCQVTVLERAVPGAEASSAAAGILGAGAENSADGPLAALCRFSLELWPDFAQVLLQRTELHIGYDPCGVIEVAYSAASAGDLQQKSIALAQATGAEPPRWLDAHELRVRVPDIAVHVCGGLLHAADSQVDPQLLMRALAIDAKRCGARFVVGQAVSGIRVEHGQVIAVQCADTQFSADAVIVAAGAWTDAVTAGLQRRTTIRPLHGELALLDLSAPLFRPVLTWQGGYIVPRRDGRVIIGATSEDIGFRKRQTAGGLLQLLTMATAAVPELANASLIAHWSGLRPQAADGLPMMGPHPQVRGLHFASGHHRNGILLAPATAQLVAQGVLDAELSHPIEPFLPA